MLKQLLGGIPVKYDIAIDDNELLDVVEKSESVPMFVPVLIVVVAVAVVLAIVLIRRAKKK